MLKGDHCQTAVMHLGVLARVERERAGHGINSTGVQPSGVVGVPISSCFHFDRSLRLLPPPSPTQGIAQGTWEGVGMLGSSGACDLRTALRDPVAVVFL